MEPATIVAKSQVNTNLSNDKIKWSDDLFSALTIEECERHFEEHYENSIDQFVETKDKLSLLRSCIELLNRLEDTTHSLFAGRVLIFLARVIPLFDQSGVNLRSEFSIKELPSRVATNFQLIGAHGAEKDKRLLNLIEQDIEEGETLSDDESNEAIPHDDSERIYERFWKVQQFLYQPNRLYDKNSWFTFRTYVDTLLLKMENKQANLDVWNLRDSYMTDPKSLSLQLNDINMRRCFLVQILIVLQYLELPVETKTENFVLDKVQSNWSSSVIKRIYDILGNMPNQDEGRMFLGLVRSVLKREEMWNRWKNDKCKEPKRPEDDDEMVLMGSTYHKRRKLSEELSQAKAYNMNVIGSLEMSRLWNMKPSQRFNTPDLGKYLHIPAEKQADSFKDPNYSFRVLRLLRKSPHFFGASIEVIQSLDGYLKKAAARYLNHSNQLAKVANETVQSQTNKTVAKVNDTSKTSSSVDQTPEVTRKETDRDAVSDTPNAIPPPSCLKPPANAPTTQAETVAVEEQQAAT